MRRDDEPRTNEDRAEEHRGGWHVTTQGVGSPDPDCVECVPPPELDRDEAYEMALARLRKDRNR